MEQLWADIGFIVDHKVYLIGNSYLKLPMNVVSVKIFFYEPFNPIIIDNENNLWLCSINPNTNRLLDEYNNITIIANPTLLTDKVKVVDVCQYGPNLIILSKDGDLYFMHDYKKIGNIEKLDIDTKFVSINSTGTFRGVNILVVAIDDRGNLWSNSDNFLGPAMTKYYSHHVNKFNTDVGQFKFKQCTTDINFVQAEYGGDNLMCLDNEGDLYCIGRNYSYDLILNRKKIYEFTKISLPIKIRKFFRAFELL